MASNLKYPTALRNAHGDSMTKLARGVYATGTITFTGNPANADTVTIGGKVYTFDTALSNTDGHVKIGAANTNTATNLANAINNVNGGVSGTDYAAVMTGNPVVTASVASNVVTITALAEGTGGNNVTLAKSSANITVSGANLASGAFSQAKLRIYSGTQPADANTALSGNTLLAELLCDTYFAAAAASSVLTLNAIAQTSSAAATGTATFFRLVKNDGTTVICDGTVGTSSADCIINSVAISSGAIVSCSSATFTAGNA